MSRSSSFTDNAATITVIADLSAVNITPTGAQTICASGSGSLLTAAETGGGAITSRQWGKRSVSGGAILISVVLQELLILQLAQVYLQEPGL